MDIINVINSRQITTYFAANINNSNYIDVSSVGATDFLIVLLTGNITGTPTYNLSFGAGSSNGQIIHILNGSDTVIFDITRTDLINGSWTGNPGDIISFMWTGKTWAALYRTGPTTAQWVDFPSLDVTKWTSTIQGLSVQDAICITRGRATNTGITGGGTFQTVQAPVGIRGTFNFSVPAENAGNPLFGTALMDSGSGIVSISGITWQGPRSDSYFDLAVNYNISN